MAANLRTWLQEWDRQPQATAPSVDGMVAAITPLGKIGYFGESAAPSLRGYYDTRGSAAGLVWDANTSSRSIDVLGGATSDTVYGLLLVFEVAIAGITSATTRLSAWASTVDSATGRGINFGNTTGFLTNETACLVDTSSNRSGITDDIGLGLHTLVVQWDFAEGRYKWFLDGKPAAEIHTATPIGLQPAQEFRYFVGRVGASEPRVCPALLALNLSPRLNFRRYADSPWQLFEPQRIWVPVSAGGGASVGLSTETDTAQALTAKQLAAAGMATETAAAQQLSAVSLAAVGLAAESDAALALSAMQLQAVGRADESDVALVLSAGASAPVGIALGADAALALSALQIAGTGAALETDTALALEASAPGAVGVALESDTAFGLSAVQSMQAGMATDTEAALALAAVQAITAGMSLEIDAGMSLAGLQARGVGRSDEVDAALGLLPGGSGTGATAAEIWSYTLSSGLTAEATLVAIHTMLSELHLIHGLTAGSPLSVTATSRAAGAVSQAVAEAAGTVTVTRQ